MAKAKILISSLHLWTHQKFPFVSECKRDIGKTKEKHLEDNCFEIPTVPYKFKFKE